MPSLIYILYIFNIIMNLVGTHSKGPFSTPSRIIQSSGTIQFQFQPITEEPVLPQVVESEHTQ